MNIAHVIFTLMITLLGQRQVFMRGDMDYNQIITQKTGRGTLISNNIYNPDNPDNPDIVTCMITHIMNDLYNNLNNPNNPDRPQWREDV